jgi:23S rRNA (guanosine2251-2'-O)-methyltransferase
MKNEIIYAIHPVMEALKAKRRKFIEIFLSSSRVSKRLKAIEDCAKSKNIPVSWVSDSELNGMAREVNHQGVLARVNRYPIIKFDRFMVPKLTGKNGQLLILLDGIVDPHNLGAIIRTALGVHAMAVLIPKKRAVGPTPAVSKASSGALEHIQLVEVTNISTVLKALKARGWWVYGLVHQDGQSIFQSDLTGNVAMVIGGEERGLRTLVKQNCDFLLTIPQQGQVASLNASVAAAVAMYEVYRQQYDSDKP